MDAHYARNGSLVGHLHGIPVIVKDNHDTFDLPTTAGSLTLKGSIPADDAYQVRRLEVIRAFSDKPTADPEVIQRFDEALDDLAAGRGALIEIAYGYEQATHHRRPPRTTPPLRRD